MNGLAGPVWKLAVCAACKLDLFAVRQAEERIARMGPVQVMRHATCGHPIAYRSGVRPESEVLEPAPLSR